MAARFRLGFLLIALLVLVGCSGGQISQAVEVNTVTNPAVERELFYVDKLTQGPSYAVTVTVPDEWVGTVEVRTSGNQISFDYITETGVRAPIFFIDALSEAQYWEQIGSLPGQYEDLLNSVDTYFVYHLPIDAYYSGLSDEEFAALAEQVPTIAQSFEAEQVPPTYFGR